MNDDIAIVPIVPDPGDMLRSVPRWAVYDRDTEQIIGDVVRTGPDSYEAIRNREGATGINVGSVAVGARLIATLHRTGRNT